MTKRKFDTTISSRQLKDRKKFKGYSIILRDLGGMPVDPVFGLMFESEVINLDRKYIKVGRGDMNNIDLTDEKGQISRIHAKLELKDKLYYITDLGSSNGTYINGHPLSKRKEMLLNPDDVIMFGGFIQAKFIKRQTTQKSEGVVEPPVELPPSA